MGVLNVTLMGESYTIESFKEIILYQVITILFNCIASESNGVLIGDKDFDFEPKRWYFLGIEHDKPYLSRA